MSPIPTRPTGWSPSWRRTRPRSTGSGSRRPSRPGRGDGAPRGGLLVVAGRRRPVVLGQALDALAGAPLGVVVLHGVQQLAHEARREVDARDDDAGDLVVLDLVVDAREGERELVVRMADVREVRVLAGHVLRLEVDVDVPLGALLFVGHCRP